MLKTAIIFLTVIFGGSEFTVAQDYKPTIEPAKCMIKVDPKLITTCGYLSVPENRQRPKGRRIKIPFVFVRKPEQSLKNVTLLTTGGPGYSTLANIDSIGSNSGYFDYGGFIAFDQRGTKKSQPCLDCPEVPEAMKRAYAENLPLDSLRLIAVKQCRLRLEASGIDLSAYNTIESAADINDLRIALGLDSINLFGISYSGGLMLTVVRNHPEGVKSIILNSPLPGFVNYEEHALFNHQEALDVIFRSCEVDSANDARYVQLQEKFQRYFTSITGQQFTFEYVERVSGKKLNITYTKHELLEAIIDRVNTSQLKTVPFVIHEIINGRHDRFSA